jgi:antitoxin component YwqK of YwqJK toxin-antitoxin module
MAEKIVLESMFNLPYMDVNIIPIVKKYIYDFKTSLYKIYIGLDCNKKQTIVLKYRTRYGVQDGPFNEYEVINKKLRLIKRGNYINGKLEGKIEKYYDGKLIEEINYKEGKIQGFFKEFDIEGKLIRQEEYKNDILHGECMSWYSNGSFREKRTYNDGEIQELKMWWENGELRRTCIFFPGIIPFGKNHNGKIWSGEDTVWYDNGNMWSYILYNKGEKVEEKRFSKNGKVLNGDIMLLE